MPRAFDFIKETKKESKALFTELKAIAMEKNCRRPSVKLAAIGQLLDRAYGKPKETIETKGGPRLIELYHAVPPATIQNKQGGVGKDTTQPRIIAGRPLSTIIPGQEAGQNRQDQEESANVKGN